MIHLRIENISSLIYLMIYFRHAVIAANADNEKKNLGNRKRYSAPPLSNQTKDRFRSPFSSTTSTSSTVQNGTNGNHSEEYESPEKV